MPSTTGIIASQTLPKLPPTPEPPEPPDPPEPPTFPSIASVAVNYTLPADPNPAIGPNRAMTMPSGIVAGNLIISYVSVDSGDIAVSARATYSQLFARTLGAGLARHGLAARIATGTSDDNLTWSGSTYSTFAVTTMRIIDHGLTTASLLKYSVTESTTSAPPNPPSLDALVSAANLWIAIGAMDRGTPNEIDGHSAGYDLVSSVYSQIGSFNTAHRICSRQLETQIEDPAIFSESTTDGWMACTVVVPPS